MPADLGGHHHVGGEVGAQPAVRARHADAQQAGCAQVGVVVERKAGLAVVARRTWCELLATQCGGQFDQFALLANQANSNLSTFRALAKKYPELAPDKLLGHLIASTPGAPGKWFATAKTLRLFDRATQLAWASPCDPKTLTRAARDHLVKQPAFAMQAALAALHWMSMGHGYELTGLDAHEAHRLVMEAARTAGQIDQAEATIEQVLAADRPMSAWMRRSLGIPTVTAKPSHR